MRQDEYSKLMPGVYVIFWTDGGFSVASVGISRKGIHWVAPANWCSPAEPGEHWDAIKEVYRIEHFEQVDRAIAHLHLDGLGLKRLPSV